MHWKVSICLRSRPWRRARSSWTLDCVGNRGFCHDHWNCVIAEPNAQSLGRAVHRTLTMTPSERGRMHLRARETAARYSLAAERQRFHAILGDIDRLWRVA